MERKEMVSVRGLSKRYGALQALDDVSFTLSEGDLFGFIGPNGAGKTTCLRILATVLRPDCGEALIGGISAITDAPGVRRIMGFMPDFLGVYDDMKVQDYLEFFARAYHIEGHMRVYAIREVATTTGMDSYLDRPVESLSRGMKQRLGLAKTLLHSPRVLLLDEPASGLDPRARIEFRDIIRGLQKSGKTVIISSHILSDLADICNKVGIIEKGRILYCEETQNLIKRLSQGKKVRLRTLSGGEKARSFLEERAKVSEVRWDGSDLLFSFDGDDQQMYELLRVLMENDIDVVFFGEFSDTLEHVYMKITQEAGVFSG